VRRNNIVGHAINHAVLLQPLQGLGEHAFAHPVDGPPELAEAVGAALEGDHDQHAPLAGDVLEHLSRRAGGDLQIAAPDLFGEGRRVGRGRGRIAFHAYKYVGTYKK